MVLTLVRPKRKGFRYHHHQFINSKKWSDIPHLTQHVLLLTKKPIEVWEYSTGKYISFPMRYERNSDGNLPHSPFPTMVIPRELMRILPDVTGNGKSKLAAFIHELSI